MDIMGMHMHIYVYKYIWDIYPIYIYIRCVGTTLKVRGHWRITKTILGKRSHWGGGGAHVIAPLSPVPTAMIYIY